MAGPKWLIDTLRVVAVVLATLVVLSLAAGLYLYSLSQTLPDIASAPENLKAPRTSIVYASDGSVLAEWHGEQDRKIVRLDAVPKAVRDAIIAAEDPRFYQHTGVDTGAILRALRGQAAGSTITQQLVRLMMTPQDRSFTGKVRQALMAYEVEGRTPKDRVLEAYLNMAYFGQGRYGVESAARGYFGKPVSSLTLSEAAMLAGLIRSPARFAPASYPAAAKARRNDVLSQMRDLQTITSEQEVAARAEPIAVMPVKDTAKVAPYFVEYVKQDLIERLGATRVFTGGLRVHTTLDPAVQAHAETAVRTTLGATSDPEVALVCIDPHTGGIVAMIGGRDFASGQYNLATQGRRQPGSAFKPFVLVTALERGVSPDRRFATAPYSVPVKDGVWRVTNFEDEFPAAVISLRAATDYSVNAVYARLVMEVGAGKVVETAHRMGITSALDANPAIALGGLARGVSPLEMASAYGTLATGGVRREPTAIAKVTDDRGSVLYEAGTTGERVLNQNVAAQASGMLHEVVEKGTGVNARIGVWAAGKTGTTQNYRDAWFVGYTPDLVASVWVGFREAQVSMTSVHGVKVAGGTFPATIWARLMGPIGGRRPARPDAGGVSSDVPTGSATASGTAAQQRVRICASSFLLANPRCPKVFEVDLPPELVPKAVCNVH